MSLDEALMRKLGQIAFSIMVLASCNQPPSNQELASRFISDPSPFKQLGQMIREDSEQKDCFVVGLDNIGDYWEFDGQWDHGNDYKTKLTLPQVLNAVGLSEARYEKYKRLFAASNSERVSFCRSGRFGPRISVLVYRAGLAVSGCSGTINWQEVISPAEGRRSGGDFTEITPLQDGWYIEFSCT